MLDKIKKIREITGAGMVIVKEALQEANGDETKAIEILRKKGQDKALKKAGRETREGLVVSYIHSNGKMGALVKVFCETDFVARTDEFQTLAKDIAMHVAAMDPKVLRPEDASVTLVEKEREIWQEQLKNEGKPEAMWEKIMAGKEDKFRKEQALLTQAFVKEPKMTVGDLVQEKVAKIGENIQLGEFVRFEL
ncbi:elongation factor Ts [Patescibacteria group bacterium]|nr:MAG: elongation factor Ts [Patescibacteria group bacterium]